jgi:hypothetical protein
MLDRGRRQRSRPLADGARVGAQLGCDGERGQHVVLGRGHGHRDRRVVSRTPVTQLAGPARKLCVEQPAQPC